MRLKLIITLLIITIVLSTIAFIKDKDYLKEKEIQDSNKESMKIDLVAYNSILNTYKITAITHFDNLIENKKVIKILQKFKYETSENERTFLRGELFRLLNKKYNKLKKQGIRQFHFHTDKGESLLRFHKPSKNGDSLIQTRKSIRFVKNHKKPFFGFEGGKIFPGFRYVFPIVYNNDYLGSVEFSIPFDLIEEKLQGVLPKIGYQLHLDKEISYDKVFEQYKDFFKISPLIKEHYIESVNISNVEKKLYNNDLIQKIQSKLKPLIQNRYFMKKENFSLSLILNHEGYRVSFIPVKEFDGTDAAHLVCYSKFHQLVDIQDKYFIFKIWIIVAALVILILILIVFIQVNHIIIKNENIQQLLDSQDSIVILTNGSDINFTNLKLFEFFGFKDLNEFKKHHQCICDYFIRSDRFFHLGKVKEDENWVEAINSLPNSKKIVSMLSQDSKIHLFSVTINKFNNNYMIINFTDISQTMMNYIELEDKTIHDKLTNAFNREYFEQNYERLINKYNSNDSYFALAMLDIDYFKRVNDTYGHDIGDDVLVHFVETIKKYSREDDILIRWGGEEFFLILKIYSKENLEKALEHIRKVIEIEEFSAVGHISCSIGATIYYQDENIENTIKRSDLAMYEAKTKGRNQVVILLG